jgi:hypothetical protein
MRLNQVGLYPPSTAPVVANPSNSPVPSDLNAGEGSMAAYTKESFELLQKLASTDLNKLHNLHIRVNRFHSWLKEKRGELQHADATSC